ncbi:MAG: hypothetical protein J4G17_11690 [Anaerolineae bacterium]|nr:hypothetical protein [Anaerolineae bacterium]
MASSGNTLSLNLWDLAEWCSLNPLSQQAIVPLGSSLGLRCLPLFLLALAIWRDDFPARLGMTLALLTAIALLPPPEFLLVDPGNSNHRQQMATGILALLCGLAGRSRLTRQSQIHWILAGTSVAVAWVALSAALALQKSMGLETHAGPGFFLFLAAMLLLLAARWQKIRTTRFGPPLKSIFRS